MTHVSGHVATAPRPSRSEPSSTAVFPNAGTKKVCDTAIPPARELSSYLGPFVVNDFSFHHQRKPAARIAPAIPCAATIPLIYINLRARTLASTSAYCLVGESPFERRTRCESYVFAANGQVLARLHTRSKCLRISAFRAAACGAGVSKSRSARF